MIVIYYHYDIYSCINCSFKFVWWNSLILNNYKSNLVPVVYIILQMISTLTVLFKIRRFYLLGLIDIVVGTHCALNIIYWSYIVYLSKDSIYYIYILTHILYIFTYVKCLWSKKNRKRFDEVLDS